MFMDGYFIRQTVRGFEEGHPFPIEEIISDRLTVDPLLLQLADSLLHRRYLKSQMLQTVCLRIGYPRRPVFHDEYCVKREAEVAGRTVLLRKPKDLAKPHDLIHEARVVKHDSLGLSGGTGGIDHIGISFRP